jgi:hypothetical protein
MQGMLLTWVLSRSLCAWVRCRTHPCWPMWEGAPLLLQALQASPGGHPPEAPGTARSIVQLMPEPVDAVDSFCAFVHVQSTTHMATHQLSFCTVYAILPQP